jgi:hypothetical protein
VKRTLAFTLTMIAIALIYEVCTLTNDIPGDTISEAMWKFFSDFPLFAFILGDILGMLKGHFWWPLTDKTRKQ